ncbi:bacterial transcriptional activator domain-containing protein [Frankia sp. CiP3]|uniref:AfsR/SARP family transcriptional regulator n=1 Tax=Frankia sp. CiP3 TaxID=2880971 RepID=UPI001EF658A4|nr:bacterial transcriptional activator domain-containing protein [Frankia sp. CiP3]
MTRQAVPDEMFPTVLLVTSVEETLAGRTGTANGHGRQLGLFTLALGHWPGQLTVTLDSDGTQTAPAGGRGDAWWQLTAASAADLLRLAAAAQDIHLPDEATPPVFSTATPAPARPAMDRRVRLVLFGRPTLAIDGRPHTKGVLTKSLEIAAYLAFHSGGVSGDQLAGELIADREPAKAANQIYRAVGALRGEIRQATSDRDTVFVAGGKTGYQLNPDHVTVDLWEFGTAERTAGHARDDPARIAALTTAAELACNRPLADVGYSWAAGYVADLEHRITGVLADLADLYVDDNPDRALAYLEQAIVLTPHVDDLYGHMMRIHAARGRTDAVRRTYQRLADALEHLGLDVDPTPDTQALLARLTRTQQSTPPPGPGHTGPRLIIRPAVSRPVDPPTAGS